MKFNIFLHLIKIKDDAVEGQLADEQKYGQFINNNFQTSLPDSSEAFWFPFEGEDEDFSSAACVSVAFFWRSLK